MSAARDVTRIVDERGEHEIRRLLNEWSPSPIRAAAFDPDRTTRPNVVDDDGVPVPQVSDPTAAAAMAPADVDLIPTVRRCGEYLIVLAALLAREIRDPNPDGIEHQTTSTRPEEIVTAECAACGRLCSRGDGKSKDDKDYLTYIETHPICGSHNREFRKPKWRTASIDDFIRSYAWRRGSAA